MGDLVLKRSDVMREDVEFGKLGKNWKGVYKVSKVISPSTYKLAKLDGRVISHSWNICNL